MAAQLIARKCRKQLWRVCDDQRGCGAWRIRRGRGYAGHEWDGQTQAYYAGARYLIPPSGGGDDGRPTADNFLLAGAGLGGIGLAKSASSVVRTSKRGYKLIKSAHNFSWAHILKRHAETNATGGARFPLDMSKNNIKKLIVEAAENGDIIRDAGEMVQKVYKPGRYGVKEIKVWVSKTTKKIKSGFPTKGTDIK